jgi:hypothetical protein
MSKNDHLAFSTNAYNAWILREALETYQSGGRGDKFQPIGKETHPLEVRRPQRC